MRRRSTVSVAAYFAGAFLANGLAAGDDWRGWRGDGSGTAAESGLPVEWSEAEGILWKAAVPGRGVSCPVVAGQWLYVTSASGYRQDRLHVLCLDAASGKRQWERQLWATGSTQCHPKTSMAAPTPATDGERLYALFASGDVVCFDADGSLLWYRSLAMDYPVASNQVGMASSPVLCGDLVVISMDTDAESYLAALDALTGVNRWKVPREKGINWVTPLVAGANGDREIILQSSRGLEARDPRTGAVRWSLPEKCDSIPSPVAGNGLVFAVAGDVFAMRPGGAGKEPEILWRSNKLRGSTASPLFYENRVYALNSAGVLTCAGEKDGAVLWQERLKGPFSASPVAGDGKIYCVNEEGVTSVLDVRSSPQRVLGQNPIGEEVLASPAIAGARIYLRTSKALVCVGEKSGKPLRLP